MKLLHYGAQALFAPKRNITLKNVGIISGLSGADDVVESVCPYCSFEMRSGIGGKVHGILCPRYEKRIR